MYFKNLCYVLLLSAIAIETGPHETILPIIYFYQVAEEGVIDRLLFILRSCTLGSTPMVTVVPHDYLQPFDCN